MLKININHLKISFSFRLFSSSPVAFGLQYLVLCYYVLVSAITFIHVC